ncbi:hypothetical protein D3C85_1569150 [compost metagenome]
MRTELFQRIQESIGKQLLFIHRSGMRYLFIHLGKKQKIFLILSHCGPFTDCYVIVHFVMGRIQLNAVEMLYIFF